MSCFWFFSVLLLIISCNSLSHGGHAHNRAVVVGTVYCDTRFQDDFSPSSHFISGGSVAVECKAGNSSSRFQQEVKTNNHGEFKVQLPFSVSKHVDKIKGCKVKLVKSNEPYCAVASTTTSSSSIHLKSRKHGIHVFSAGFFTFKPLKQPTLCNQKLVKAKQSSPPPPPPAPSSPPNTFPPRPPAAPPSLLFPFPPIPGLTPSPSPSPLPSPAAFPFPLPPFPFLPFPPFPPASTSP